MKEKEKLWLKIISVFNINKVVDSCKDELLFKNYILLFIFNLIYLLGHIIFCVEFIILGIPEMIILNIASIIWFIFNAYRMIAHEMDHYTQAEILMMVEIIIHQLIAFYFIGNSCGFQFVLLSCSCTLFTLYKNRRSKRSYLIKSFIMIFLFIVIECFGRYYTPVYFIDPDISNIWKASVIFYAFVVISVCTLFSYINVSKSMDDFKAEVIKQNKKILDMQIHVITSFANVIGSRDGSTGEHTKRTGIYMEKILNGLRKYKQYSDIMTDEYIHYLKLAAPLHDIGKIKVPDSVLQKPGKLTTEEIAEVQKHTLYGGHIIKEAMEDLEDPVFVKIAYNVAAFHHERWDGSGYPLGLKGEKIPLEARIMAFADVFDALTSKRCYKEGLSDRETFRIIEEEMGRQFDPKLGKIVLEILREDR